MSLFGACWALVTMKALAEEGAHATTWFETTGPRGVIDGGTAEPASSLFPAHPGLVFPVYHMLRDVCEFGGAPLLACSGDPLRAAAIAVRRGDRSAVLVANLRPEPSAIEVRLPRQLPRSGVTIRRLNTMTATAAMLSPASFRSHAQAQPVHGICLRPTGPSNEPPLTSGRAAGRTLAWPDAGDLSGAVGWSPAASAASRRHHGRMRPRCDRCRRRPERASRGGADLIGDCPAQVLGGSWGRP
jgi:hypothetical protein